YCWRDMDGVTREGMASHVSPTLETVRGPTARLGPPDQGDGTVATGAWPGEGPARRGQPLARARGPRAHRSVLRDRAELPVPRDRHPRSYAGDPRFLPGAPPGGV